jgi:hypothetical protein
MERIVFQVFYRQLGMVSVHCGISTAAQAIDTLCKKGYGSWKWLLQDRALVWQDIPVNGAAKVHAYVFGGKLRDQNTVIVRQGFYRMYVLESAIRAFNETIVGRILASIP